MAEVDPYHKWLGIPRAEQPPTHYRLIGVQDFEQDPDVIESAADRQMAHLRTFQGGARGELSQRLLNEVSRARGVLLSPDAKRAYDQGLRAKFDDRAMVTQPAVTTPPAPIPAHPPATYEPNPVVASRLIGQRHNRS